MDPSTFTELSALMVIRVTGILSVLALLGTGARGRWGRGSVGRPRI